VVAERGGEAAWVLDVVMLEDEDSHVGG
jgi:hypothetical protein